MPLKNICVLLMILMLSTGITLTASDAGAEVNSVRLETGQVAPFDGTLYNVAADAEINIVLIENEEYEKALFEAVNKRNKYFFWAIGSTATTIILLLLK